MYTYLKWIKQLDFEIMCMLRGEGNRYTIIHQRPNKMGDSYTMKLQITLRIE